MPKGIRPTQEKVRKAFFDILGNVEGLSFLELFAGSGAIGFEAVSRRAKEVVFVEKDKRIAKIIQDNLSLLRCSCYRVIASDAIRAIKTAAKNKVKFDIVFLDPPYYRELSKKTLQILGAYDILTPNGLIIAQHFKKESLPEAEGDLTLFRQSRYGDTVLSFYKK